MIMIITHLPAWEEAAERDERLFSILQDSLRKVRVSALLDILDATLEIGLCQVSTRRTTSAPTRRQCCGRSQISELHLPATATRRASLSASV
jgi:hypothetical protein